MQSDNEHFTYLLGAGASCGRLISKTGLYQDGLPLVSNMGARLEQFDSWLEAIIGDMIARLSKVNKF